MPRHSSYRSNHGLDPVGNDWSSSQLIIGIAVAIVFGVTCFAAGYVIALYDNPLTPVASNTGIGGQIEAPPTPVSSTSSTSTTPPAGEKLPGSVTPPAVEAPVKVTPPPAAQPPAQTPTASTEPPAVTEPAKPSDTIQRPGLRPTTIGALPEPGGPTPVVRTPVDLSKAPAPQIQPMEPDEPMTVPGITPPTPSGTSGSTATKVTTITPPTPAPATPPTPAAKSEGTPATTKPVETKEPAEPQVAKTPETAKPPAKPATEQVSTPTATKGSFGIQVASFDGPQRSAQAKEFQRNIKAKAQQNADIIVTADGTYHKVVISGFDTRDAAKAACEKLKSKPGLEGAWVVRLP